MSEKITEEITEEMRIIATESGLDPNSVECWCCLDGTCAPWYGMAPHNHFGQSIIGSTEMLPKREWPANFEPDWDDIPEEEREGYTGNLQGTFYCPDDCRFAGITIAKELMNGPCVPNEETVATFIASDAGEFIEYESKEEMFKDLGLDS